LNGHHNATSIHSLALGGQVVHARRDVLVVIIDLHVKELGLGVECRVGLLQFDQLSFPALAIPPLIPDVLYYERTHTQKTNEAGAVGNPIETRVFISAQPPHRQACCPSVHSVLGPGVLHTGILAPYISAG